MKYDYIKLANIIKDVREENRISIRELERKTGINHSEISKLENGQKPNFSFNMLLKICDALEINLESLLIDIGLIEDDEDCEEQTYYVLVRNKSEEIFEVRATCRFEAMSKVVDIVIDNRLIELDKNIPNIDILARESLDDFKENHSNAVTKFLYRTEKFDEEIKEEDKENYNYNSVNLCENCKYYCPICEECTYEE